MSVTGHIALKYQNEIVLMTGATSFLVSWHNLINVARCP
jgi:hypothetical protein